MEEKPLELGALVLAAGKGTRMKSNLPKVLHPLLEEPVLYYPLKALRDAGIANVAVVIGHGGEELEAYLSAEWPDVKVVWQHEQLGTGHAVQVAEEWWCQFEHLLVLSGDVPLVRPETLLSLLEKHEETSPECTFISVLLDDPTGYGRVVRLADGGVRIVEDKDTVSDEKDIREINAGVYVFKCTALQKVIPSIGQNNQQKEFYLTDAIHLIADQVGMVDLALCEDQGELRGINTPYELADAAALMRDRIVRNWMGCGVKCMDPLTTWIGPRVQFEAGAWLAPDVQIWGRSHIGSDSCIGTHSQLCDVDFQGSVTIHGPSVISNSTVMDGAEIGPFAFLRDGVVVDTKAKVGRFVEIKKSHIGSGSKVPHLSYIGDTTIGKNTNIGAGTITCNYDGVNKNKTVIGDGCFVGSDTMLVAPVTLGDAATTGAGSTITQDIPAGALGIARERQHNIDGWSELKALRRKKEKE